jgi:AcrR family transcriptional regulator
MAQSGSAAKLGLRERKKLRTRETIIRVGLDLFARKGFHATTLAEIAEAAELSPSTLHTYFPSKEDIAFHVLDEMIATARARIVERPASEPLIEAIRAWVKGLSEVVEQDMPALRRRRDLIEGDEKLQAVERLRLALLEDVFAEAFARDFGEEADGLRCRLMASTTVNGLRAIWLWWYRRHADGDRDLREPFALDATYLTRLIMAAEAALEELPMPDEHLAR